MNSVEIKQINEDIYVLTDTKSGHYNNSTMILTEEGPIIIDVFKDKEQSEEIRNFIKQKNLKEPILVIYTHWHVDHTCGNCFINGCKVISHKSTLTHLESFIKEDLERLIQKEILDKDTRVILPNETFDHEILLNIGNKTLRLTHCPGHSYDSILIYSEKDQVLIAGDNIIGKEVPFFMPPTIPPDSIDAKSKDLEKVYRIIEELCPSIIIPGHGGITEANELIEVNKKRYFQCIEENLKYID